MPIIDKEFRACSQEPVVEALSPTHHGPSFGTDPLEAHPIWSTARTVGFENASSYTDGPSRIVLANDGSKDCVALLLTPDLVAALNQIAHAIREVERKNGALERLESEIVDLKLKADYARATIGNPTFQDRTEEMQLVLEILELETEEAKERKSQVNIELLPFESSLKLSRLRSQGIFEKALLEAGLLDRAEPGSPSTLHNVEDRSCAGEYSDAPSIYEGTEPSLEQLSFREARLNVTESYETLRTTQARFDDRQANYEQKLAGFQRSEADPDNTRTQFDHQHIRHVQNLTRDLISAGQGYKAAKAQARALESPAEPNGIDSGFVSDGNRVSDELHTEPSVDQERIKAWTRGVLPPHDTESLEHQEPSDLEDWNARRVETTDSVSVMDRGGYADELNDWKEHCRLLKEHQPNQ